MYLTYGSLRKWNRYLSYSVAMRDVHRSKISQILTKTPITKNVNYGDIILALGYMLLWEKNWNQIWLDKLVVSLLNYRVWTESNFWFSDINFRQNFSQKVVLQNDFAYWAEPAQFYDKIIIERKWLLIKKLNRTVLKISGSFQRTYS